MTAPVLDVSDLTVTFGDGPSATAAVRGLSLSIGAGESVGVVGESGSGKSTVALAVLDHLGRGGRIAGGTIRLGGRDVAGLTAAERLAVRRTEVAVVYQDPISALNPSMTIGAQLAEVPAVAALPKAERRAAVERILADVQLPDPQALVRRYPHQLSGGQQQRVVIAMALLAAPRLLILDEPTTGLDATVEAEILDLIARLRRSRSMAMLFISHNLGVVAHVCDRVLVMQGGACVEEGPAAAVLGTPRHPYTRALLDALARRPRQTDPALAAAAAGAEEPVLRIASLTKTYRPAALPFLGRAGAPVHANRDIDILVRPGEILGVVGESGSGKSTFAKILAGLETATGGSVEYRREDIAATPARRRSPEVLRSIQMVFQNPDRTLNPSHTVGFILGRAIQRLDPRLTAGERAARVAALLDLVRLAPEIAGRLPDQLSGGQRQRVAIARAFAAEPRIVICDEPVSALDVIVQAAVVDLLREVQARLGTTLIFISHDIDLVAALADRVAVMHRGVVVDFGPTAEVFADPRSDYTRRLLAAAATTRLPPPPASAA